jgi:hypothetical protein
MRISMWMTGLLVVGLSTACEKKTESDISAAKPEAIPSTQPALSAQVEAKTTLVRAVAGGNLVAVGKFTVELLLHAEGKIESTITDGSGKLVEAGRNVKLMVRAPSKAEQKAEVQLDWNAEAARFVGHAKRGVELRGGPVEVKLSVDGKAATGKLAAAAVLAGPRYGGTLLAAGEYGAEVRTAADGEIEAHLWDASLKPVTGSAGLEVVANLGAEAKAGQAVTLEWDAPRACFLGKAHLDAAMAPPALKLSVRAGGKAHLGRLARITLLGKAQHDGMVLAAGDYSVELVTTTPKLLQAFVMDASGKAHASGDLKLQLELEGAPKLAFAWHAPCACYQAKLTADLDLHAKPIKLSLVADGRVHLAAAANLKAKADADLKAKAGLAGDAAARAKAGLKAGVTPPKVSAGAKATAGKGASAKAGATVKVKPPSVNVNVGTKKSGKAKAGFSLGTK